MTITELLIAMGIFAMVIALIGLPLLAAFGYLQKAAAQRDVQNAARKAVQQMAAEIGNAEYVFPLPADGSFVGFLLPQTNTTASGFNENLFANSATSVSYVRYAQMLDFPWDGPTLLQPNYANTATTYASLHTAFYSTDAAYITPNPYIVGRYATTSAWATVLPISQDGSFPMDTYPAATPPTLKRQVHNDLVAITPYGEAWDAPYFQVAPLHVASEGLTMLVDGRGVANPQQVSARYPLWAGRNSDLDLIVTQPALSASSAFNIADFPSLSAFTGTYTPLYQPYYNTYGYQNSNPYGYQLWVYDHLGGVQYGVYYDTTNTPYFMHNRHYMEWPPIDRADGTIDPANPNNFISVTGGGVLWTKTDIDAQRSRGKVVFAQPYSAYGQSLQFASAVATTFSDAYQATLPIPAGWSAYSTYLVAPPHQLQLAGISRPLTFVNTSPGALGDYQYCWLNKGNYTNTSRTLLFRCPEIAAGFPYTILHTPNLNNISASVYANSPVYTICDLQPDDMVVASYCTNGVLDISLTVSRQDRAGGTVADSRQDGSFNARIEVRNALQRARGM